MAKVITVHDPTIANLEECVEAISTWGFDPTEEESLAHAANWLKRLANDPQFLGDALVEMLTGQGPATVDVEARPGLGSNAIMLAESECGNFVIGADIWPSVMDHAVLANGPEAFGYGRLHDHNFDFLRAGYFGPGCEVDNYEYDTGTMTGWLGEPVSLHSLGRSRLGPGRLFHYRAHRDVQCQHPPKSLSVTLTLSHVHGAQAWSNHHTFERGEGAAGAFRIAKVQGHGPSETFLRVAVALGSEEASDLAYRFGRHHPSDRMRLTAWQALASVAESGEERDEIWGKAEGSGSRLVAEVAKRRRA